MALSLSVRISWYEIQVEQPRARWRLDSCRMTRVISERKRSLARFVMHSAFQLPNARAPCRFKKEPTPRRTSCT